MSYSDTLPKRLIPCLGENERCMALRPDGNCCDAAAVVEVSLHLDSELYPRGVNWVRATVCQDHIPDCDRRELALAHLKSKGVSE